MKHHPGLLGVDGIQARAACEASTEADHALGKTDLAQVLIALFGGYMLGREPSSAPALLRGGLGADGGVINYLIVDGLVRVAE